MTMSHEEKVQRVLRDAGIESAPLDPSSLDALRNLLKHRHETDFRLIIGDVNAEETLLRLTHLDRIRILPSEIAIHQSKEGMEDEEEPENMDIVLWESATASQVLLLARDS